MSKFLLSLLILFTCMLSSCTTRRYQMEMSRMRKTYGLDKPVQVYIIMPDSIDSSQKDIPIHVKVENLTNREITVNNLSNWYNAVPRLCMNDSVIAHSIRVNSHKDKEHYILEKQGEMVFMFDFSFDQIYNLKRLQPGEYEMYHNVRPLYDYPNIGIKSQIQTIHVR